MGRKSRLHVTVCTAVLQLNGGCCSSDDTEGEKDLLDRKQGRPKLGYRHLTLTTDRNCCY